MKRLFALLLFCGLGLVSSRAETPPPLTVEALWDTREILAAPLAPEFGEIEGLTQDVWYDGVPLAGKMTRVFSILGRPAGSPAEKRPAVLLVRGGGGQAFREWARHWADRGYVALATDTAGQGPDGKHRAEESGPDQADTTKFREFTPANARDQWTYHAVAAVVRGRALLQALPEVDADRIAVTGISWGGYLTCLVAGIDPALKAAVPVYGCGFLGTDSVWRDRSLAALTPASRGLWLRLFDPSQVIVRAACPMLFVNGCHDFAYPPGSHRATYSLVSAEKRTLSVRVDLDHGHIWTFPEVDAFIDHALRPEAAPALIQMGDTRLAPDGYATADVPAGTVPTSAEFHFTTDTGLWTSRKWTTRPARIVPGAVTAELPAGKTFVCFFTVKDARGLITSSRYAEEGPETNSACVPEGKLEDDFYDWNTRHAAVMALRDTLNPDVVLIGDSITHLWGGVPAEPHGNRGQDSWDALFAGRRPLNLGFGWDRTQNALKRLDMDELRGLRPKHIVLLIGTNNTSGTPNARENTPAEIAEGIQCVALRIRAECPDAKLALVSVLPRGATAEDPVRGKIAAVNALLPGVAKLAGAESVDAGPAFLSPDGSLSPALVPDGVHPSAAGYRLLAEALRPFLAAP